MHDEKPLKKLQKCTTKCIQNNEKSLESPFYANGEISAENLVAKQKFGSPFLLQCQE